MLNNLEDLNKIIDESNNFLAHEKGKQEKLGEQLNDLEIQKDEIEIQEELLEKVNILFKKTSEFAREQAKNQIESLVTNCLQVIFDKNIKFEIELKESASRPSAKFFVIHKVDDVEVKLEPQNSRGGGIVDVVSLALRLAFLETHKPKIEGPLILDEPAKHVSNEYIYNVSDFLKEISELFQRQIIMITHDDFLSSIGNKSYAVELIDGVSHVSSTLSDLT